MGFALAMATGIGSQRHPAIEDDDMPRLIGEIQPWAADELPSVEWIWYPQASPFTLSRTTYAALFALWGTKFGVGDGSTTFGVPEIAGRAIIAKGSGTGLSQRTTDGEKVGSEDMPAHTHSLKTYSNADIRGNTITPIGNVIAGDSGGGSQFHTNASVLGTMHASSIASAGTGTEGVMQPSIVLPWMIYVGP